MKRQQAEAALDRFFEECAEAAPTQSEVDPVLDRIWQRLEWRADEFVGARAPVAPARPFRFVWAVGIVLVVVLVNVLVWRQGFPSQIAVNTSNDEHSFRQSSSQTRETLGVTAPQDVFEVSSVKLVSQSSDAFNAASRDERMQLAFMGCPGGSTRGAQLDPGRLTIPAVTVLSLVIIAYGHECTLVEGGPGWARSGEYYEVQAVIPAGTPRYSPQDLMKGDAPRLQAMFQNLLADRFRLVLRREVRDMQVYALTVANRGKLKLSPDEELPAPDIFPTMPGMPRPQMGRGGVLSLMSPTGEVLMAGHAVSIPELAKNLRQHAGRIVVDKTGLNGVFDYDLKFIRDAGTSTAQTPTATPTPVPSPQSIPPVPGEPPQSTLPLPGATLHTALEERLGLKLESTRLPIEVLIIESVERPAEN